MISKKIRKICLFANPWSRSSTWTICRIINPKTAPKNAIDGLSQLKKRTTIKATIINVAEKISIVKVVSVNSVSNILLRLGCHYVLIRSF